MDTFKRKLIYTLIGLAGGAFAWTVIECLLLYQSSFSDYLTFNLVLGLVTGSLTGLIFGMSDGIIHSQKTKIVTGSIAGFIIGGIGGIIGIIGSHYLIYFSETQTVFFFTGDGRLFNVFVYLLGWVFLGICVSVVHGVHDWSPFRLKMGLYGGILSGAIGFSLMALSAYQDIQLSFLRLASFSLFGAAVMFIFGTVEIYLSKGHLIVLNGKLKGRVIPINKRYLKLGSKTRDIALPGYNIPKHSATVEVEKNVIAVVQEHAGELIVNGSKTERANLISGDIIQLGAARLYYQV